MMPFMERRPSASDSRWSPKHHRRRARDPARPRPGSQGHGPGRVGGHDPGGRSADFPLPCGQEPVQRRAPPFVEGRMPGSAGGHVAPDRPVEADLRGRPSPTTTCGWTSTATSRIRCPAGSRSRRTSARTGRHPRLPGQRHPHRQPHGHEGAEDPERTGRGHIIDLHRPGQHAPPPRYRGAQQHARSGPLARRCHGGHKMFLVKSVFRVSSLIFFGFRHEECRPVVCFTGCPSCRT